MPQLRLADAIRLDKSDVVALVGGGGKTTALRRLGSECAQRGERVVLTSTTKIEPQRDVRTVFVAGPAGLASLDGPWPVLAVTEDLGIRLRGVPPDWIDALVEGGFRVVAQADGSGRRPFKAPAEHEPVIPRSATLVISVAGIDALGSPLVEEQVHRASRVAQLSGLAIGAPVTEEAIAHVLLHPEAGGKGVPPDARRVVLLNKVETEEEHAAARRIALRIREGGVPVVIASLRRGWIERAG